MKKVRKLRIIRSTVTNFKEMAKWMRMKYDKYYGAPEKMSPWYIVLASLILGIS